MGQTFYDLLKDAAFAGGGGGSPAPAPVLIEKSISQNGTYNASTDNADGYSKVMVTVPNTYAASDEGKVVSNGVLVAQTSDTVTQNGTVDTTLINSLTVNVSGGTGSPVKLSTQTGKVTELDAYIFDTGIYIFIFGSVKYSSGSTITLVLDIPDSFNMQNIGSVVKGIRGKETTTDTSNTSPKSVDLQNKTISLYTDAPACTFCVKFSKAT